MATKRHIHKYHQVNIDSGKVWACANCNHYMPVHLSNLVPGRMSICWNCDEQFKLDPQNMHDSQPKCDDCRGILGEAIPESLIKGL